MKPLGLRAPRGNQIGPDVAAANNRPRFRMWNSIGEVGHGPGTAAVALDQVDYAEGVVAVNTASGATSLARIKTQGIYICAAGLAYASGTGARQLTILRTSATYGNASFAFQAGFGASPQNGTDLIELAAEDTLQLVANTVTDASNITAGSSNIYLSGIWISTC